MDEVVRNENQTISSKYKVAKILAIIVFSLVMSALAFAIVSDVVLFAAQILGFIAACLGSVVTFFFGFILMVISIILIFGFYLLQERGFWPLTWAKETFRSVMADYKMTQDQINALLTIRIVLLVFCVIGFGLAIATLVMSKQAKKSGSTQKRGMINAFGILSLIFSIFGIFAAVLMILLINALN